MELTNLSGFGLSEEELFAPVRPDAMAAEHIAAPAYSYWRSVWRLFLKKKTNIVLIGLLVMLLIFTFVYRGIMSDAYEKLEEFLDCFRECVEPVVITADENSKAMLIYQANTANYLKQMTELLQGNAMEQTRGVEVIVHQFLAQLEQSMGSDFAKLGNTLSKACDAQQIYAENYKSMEDTTRQLLGASLTLQHILEATIANQEALARELKAQQEKIDATCDTINEEISSQLYTFGLLKDV